MVDFRIKVIADPSRAKAGLKQVDRSLKSTARTAGTLGRSLRTSFAFLAGGAGLAGITRTLAGFAQELSTVKAISGATENQFAALEERAISLGSTTRFSATQAAEGMTFLARAGFDANQVFETVDDTLNLAQAGALDLGLAADIASNVLTAFRLETAEAGRVVDVLALAANSSNTTVTQLGVALKFVAPIAAGVGVGMEETVAAIEALSNAGIQASTAGTGLRRVLSELESPSKRTKEIFAELGVAADEVEISSVGLTAALTRLKAAGVDTGQALEIFGDRGGPAFEVLNNAAGDVGRFQAELLKADGTAKRIAETMDDNLNGALLATKSAFEGVILRLGQSGATGGLRSFLEMLTRGLRGIAGDIDAFVVKVQGLAFVLGTVLARQAIGAVIRQLAAMKVALLTNPLGLMATGLALVIGYTISFREELKKATDGASTTVDIVSAGWDRLKTIFTDFIPVIAELGKQINEGLGGAFDGFELNLENVLLAISTFADTSVGIFWGTTQSLTSMVMGIGPTIGSGFFVILQQINEFIEGGIDRAIAGFQALATVAESMGITLRNYVREINISLTQLAQGQVDAAGETAKQAGEVLEGQLGAVGKTFSRAFKADLLQLQKEQFLDPVINPFEGAGEQMAENMMNGFEDGMSFSGFTDFILGTLDAADAQSKQAEVARELAEAQKAANIEMEAGGIAAATLGEGMNAGDEGTAKLGRSLNDGLRAGLEISLERMTDVAGAAEAAMVNGFGAAEDALVQFATTGEADFSAMAEGILADVARLLAREAILGLLNAFGGGLGGNGGPGSGVGGFFGNLFGGARAGGGPVSGDRSYLVGEEGPELFTPPNSGNIVNAQQTAGAVAAAPAPVNVSVVNVTDPSEITAAMNSPEGEQMIMNIISKNRSTINNSLG